MQKNKNVIYIFITILLFSATMVNFILVFQPLDNLESLDNHQEKFFKDPNLKISGPEINIITPENKTYSEPMSGYYSATYGFENDKTGTTGTNIGFIDTDTSVTNCEASIISDLGDHKKILQLYDNSGSGRFTIVNNFSSAQTSGTFEFWARFSELSIKNTAMYFGSQIFLTWNLGYLKFHDGGGWNNIVAVNDDTWYHVRIDFECDTGGYEDLEADEFNIWINEVKYGEYSFYTAGDDIDDFSVWSSTGDYNYYCYLDALGFSWEPNYNIGDNTNEGILLSLENSTNLDWIGYSLDGQANKTILGNTTIPMPENGPHSILIYGRDASGDYHESNFVYFTVDISGEPIPPNGENEYFMLIFFLISAFSLLGVAIAFIVFRKVHIPSERLKPRKSKLKKVKTKKNGIIEEELFCPFCQTPITVTQKFCTYCASNLKEEKES